MTLLLRLTIGLVLQCHLQVWSMAYGVPKLDPKLPHPWYIAKISRADAEAMLLERNGDGDYIQEDGAFIVTQSYSTPGDFVLLVKYCGKVNTFKILQDGSGKIFLWVVKFKDLNELVEYHRTSSVSRSKTIYLKDLKDLFQPKKYKHLVVASYDYKDEEDGFLNMKKGDIISVIEEKDANWWLGACVHGTCRYSKPGLFPKSYVKPYKM